jgi:hypothetical protein
VSDEEKSSGDEAREKSPVEEADKKSSVEEADEKRSVEDNAPRAPQNLRYEQARLAYTIIQALLEHTRVTQDIIALMAQTIDEDTQRALVNTPHWAAYLDSRRMLERTRTDVEKFAEVWTRLAEELDSPKS